MLAGVRWLCLGHGGDRADQHQHRGRDGRGSHRVSGQLSERALLLSRVLQTGVDLLQQNRCVREALSSLLVRMLVIW